MARPTFISEEIALRRSGRSYATAGSGAPPAMAGPLFNGGSRLPPVWFGWTLPPGIDVRVYPDICNGKHTNVQSDSKNCGKCGIDCKTQTTQSGIRCNDSCICCDGQCVHNQQNCGGCGIACGQDQTCCPKDGDFGCVDLRTDLEHCGACNKQCDAFPSPVYREVVRCCDNFKCLTTEDLKSDRSHCGNCDTDCGPDRICSNGHCCPKCTVWFDGFEETDWGRIGGIVGTFLGGAAGAGIGKALGDLLDDSIGPGCYSCETINEYSDHDLACCDGSTCTDRDTDPNNCGSCDTQCSTPTWNKICRNGRCVCPPNFPDECPGECVNLTTGNRPSGDPLYCGKCFNVCSPGFCCVNGVCSRSINDPANCGKCGRKCLGRSSWCCGDQCVNIDSDPKNCGACGKSCDPEKVCCSGFCANLYTDSGNCGSCDHSCYLAGGFKDGRNNCCGGECVNRQGDVTNCGHCGRRCSEGEVCVQGRCVEDIPIL
jgi:hypothetical protein